MPRLKTKAIPPLPAVIGWRERVSLPEIGISRFTAKIDTGATYCALHATEIEVHHGTVSFRFEDGDVLGTELAGRKVITSSNGEKTRRCVIRTPIKIGKHLIMSEVTLIDRSTMKDKMLIGRKFLSGRFVVDSRQSFALSVKKKKRKVK